MLNKKARVLLSKILLIIIICIPLLLSVKQINAGEILTTKNDSLKDDIKNASELVDKFGTSNLSIIKDGIFIVLKSNDGLAKEAVFVMNSTKLTNNDTLSIVFEEMCGHVNSYELVIPKTCSRTEKQCYINWTKDNSTSKEICNDIIVNYDCSTPYTKEAIVKDVKITNVNMTEGWCLINNTYYKYLVDWQTKINISGNILIDSKWAVWNATGGTITTIIDGGINYTIHTFTSNGTLNVTGTINATTLIVAGGGGGGVNDGGGGGAGGLIYNDSISLTTGSYSVVVGTGGVRATVAGGWKNGGNGTNSSFNGLVAGGGGGGGGSAGGYGRGRPGGSGGGGCEASAAEHFGGNGTTGQGYNGGDGRGASQYGGGGGGGAGGIGENGSSSAGGGDGGIGLTFNISGSSVCYAGGGGGGAESLKGNGTCGGGNGRGSGGGQQTNGTDGLGGGGGGGGVDANYAGDGGDGIVIIRYLTGESDTIKPIINLNIPENLNWTSNNTPNIIFNATDETNASFRCDLIFNNTLSGYNDSVLNNTATTITVNWSLPYFAVYNWQVNCTDGTNTGNSTSRTLYLYNISSSITAGCLTFAPGCYAVAQPGCNYVTRT